MPKSFVSSAPLSKTAVEVIDRSRFGHTPVSALSYTLGRIHPENLATSAMVGTGRGIWDTSNPKDMRFLNEAYERKYEADLHEREEEASSRSRLRQVISWLTGYDPRGQGELMVNAGSSSPIRQLRRVWTRPGISLPGRLMGTLASPASALTSAITRADNYDPWSHTVTSYRNEPGIQAHELGHAADFSRVNHPTLYALAYTIPFANLFHEARANLKAPALLNKAVELRDKAKEVTAEDYENIEIDQPDNEIDQPDNEFDSTYHRLLGDQGRAEQMLGASYGSYLGSAIGSITGVAGAAPVVAGILVGRVLGRLGKPWARLTGEMRKKIVDETLEIALLEDEEEVEEKVIRLADAVEQAAEKEVDEEGEGQLQKAAFFSSASYQLQYLLSKRAAAVRDTGTAQEPTPRRMTPRNVGIAAASLGAAGLLAVALRRRRQNHA